MQYTLGECLADNGFKFFERLHQPVFLMSRLGHMIKINEAGRKLISITHTSVAELEQLFQNNMKEHLQTKSTTRISVKSAQTNLQLIASQLKDSDYFLVEVTK